MAKDNEEVKRLVKTYNAELLYLVYKPVIGDWENQVPATEVYAAAKKSANEGIRTAVDGPCIGECLAQTKFVDIDSVGNCFQCSFIREPLGNLLKEDFKTVWKSRGRKKECKYVELGEKNGK